MGFQQGLTGLNAASKNLDVIGNNVANAGTVGFKASQAQFADVFANSLTGAGGVQIGIGTKIADVAQQFTQGNITVSNNPLDLAINGKGFFRMDQNGVVSYSRNGQFHLDKDGYIINSTGLRLTGYGVDNNGVILQTAPTDLQVSAADLTPRASTKAGIGVNLDSRLSPPATSPFNPTDPTTYNNSTSLTVYDSLGNPQIVSTYFVKSATANTWNVYGTVTDPTGTTTALNGGASLGTLTFSTTGTYTASTVTAISIPVTTGAASPLVITPDFSTSTQFGSPFGVNTLTQDGYSSGNLSGFSIGANGIVQGRYSNGQSRNLGQVVLANFVNPQGLQPLGDNQWAETSSSGAPLVGAPNTASLGVLQSSAVEDSNVDLTAELVNMITAQRVYQANAQTIKAQDTILQTLVTGL